MLYGDLSTRSWCAPACYTEIRALGAGARTSTDGWNRDRARIGSAIRSQFEKDRRADSFQLRGLLASHSLLCAERNESHSGRFGRPSEHYARILAARPVVPHACARTVCKRHRRRPNGDGLTLARSVLASLDQRGAKRAGGSCVAVQVGALSLLGVAPSLVRLPAGARRRWSIHALMANEHALWWGGSNNGALASRA